MKVNMKYLLPYLPWLLLLLGMDAFAALLLWLADVQAFYSLLAAILLATALLFSALCYVLVRLERKREQAWKDFLHNPDEYHRELLLKAVSPSQREHILLLGSILEDNQNARSGLQGQLRDYEEYVESWAHETKIPLSLLTFLLDNRREELPGIVTFKLDFIRNRMQESVDQILFYARLKGARKDYFFEYIELRACVEELLEDYKPLLEEKRFDIRCDLSDDRVYSDRRGLRFLLGQLISNSIKYCGGEPRLCFQSLPKKDRYILSVKDNGIGVRGCDLPYIFEKGFTGDSGDGRKKATGMGLYLVKEMAKDLNLSLDVSSRWGEGFEIKLAFPVVENDSPLHSPSMPV